MTTDASELPSLVRVSETDYSRQPSLDGEQQTLLDIAGMLSLTRADGEQVVVEAIAKMLHAHTAEIDANGAWRRSHLSGEIGAVTYEIAQRTELRKELDSLRIQREELRLRCGALDAAVASLETELVGRRHAAEDRQITEQIEALQAQEDEAQRRAANAASEDALTAEEVQAKREEAIRLLEAKREQTLKTEAPALERAEALTKRAITQTVAGFLLWLGYGSVAATGAVLALIMNGGDGWQFGVIVDGWRAIIDSLPVASIWLRLLAGVALLAGLLALLGGMIVLADRLLKKRPDWMKDERRSREPQVNLSPQSISSRTYTQFIAMLPFLLGAGTVGTILALTPSSAAGTTGGSNVLASVLPTLGYAFVGIVVAFLATAVFVMYVIRIIEPRQTKREDRIGVLQAGWEFVVPPVLLVAAVALMPVLLPPMSVAQGWAPWAAFMLVSSLCLACGVVYHGVFKDAKSARERMADIDARLDLERGIASADGFLRDEAVTRDYGEQLRRMQDLQRDLRLNRMGVAITGRRDDGSMLARVWHSIRRSRSARSVSELPSVSQGIASGYRPIDYDVSADLIPELEKSRSERMTALADLRSVEDSIRRREELTSFEVMVALVRRCELLKGEQGASTSEDEERKSRATVTGELLTLHARSVVANGTSVKPFFDGVRHDLSERIPYAEIPAPVSGGNDE